jgi:hypothetical protein
MNGRYEEEIRQYKLKEQRIRKQQQELEELSENLVKLIGNLAQTYKV